MPKCREAIINELKGKLSVEQVEKIFERVEEKYYGSMAAESRTAMTPEAMDSFRAELNQKGGNSKWNDVATKAFEEDVKKAEERLRQQYLQAERTVANIKYIQQNSEKGHVRDGMLKLLVGDVWGRQRDTTVEGRRNGILRLDNAELFQALDKYMGFFGFKVNEENMLNIVREFDAAGSTKDTAAQRLVKDWTDWSEKNRNRKNDLGADINKLRDWRLPQMWDPRETKQFGLTGREKAELLLPGVSQGRKDALLKKARTMWLDEAMKRVDPSRYVYQDKPLEEDELRSVLSSTFATITTRGLSKSPLIGRGGSLAEQLGAHRELHFKSAMDWYEFNKLAGQSDILGIMQRSVIANSRDMALLEVFGPNPQAGFEAVLQEAMHLDAKRGNIPFKDKVDKAQMYFNEITGDTNIPINERGELVANVMQGMRHWMVAAKMGSVLLSQLNDLASYTTIVRARGLGFFKSIDFAVKELTGTGKGGRDDAMQLYVASQSMINDVSQRLGDAVKGVDLTSRMANATIRLGGMQWWTDAMHGAFEKLVSFRLAQAAEKGLESMNPLFQNMIKKYGIGPTEWEIIQSAPKAEISGQKMISPVAVKMLGDDPIYRETAIKLSALMHEEARIAVVDPGVREQAFWKSKNPPGSFWGETARTMGLFKMFSTSLMTKVLPAIWAVEGSASFRAGLITQFAASMIIMGGGSYQLKQLAFGRNPRDIETTDFWIAAAAQSGGLGIMSDFLFADYNRFGGSFGSSVVGPVGGLVEDALKLTVGNMRQAAQGEDTHMAAETIQFVKNYTPLMNLWYTRAALDHLLFFTIQDAANPGYLRRMRSRVEKENNQTFYWDPQDKMPQEAPDLGFMLGGSKR